MPGETPFTALPGTPAVDGLSRSLLAQNPNFTNTGNGNGASNPFRLSPLNAVTADQDHSYNQEQLAFDGGAMDLFPLSVGAADSPGQGSGMATTTGLTMGYYDGNTVTALWNYAQHYAIFELPLVLYDRIFDHQGQLFYPVSPHPEHPWMDEVAGDAMVVNGRVQPFFEVEPRRYRLRVLNAANARFFRLGLSNGASFRQIGADQGLLPAPVELATLLLAPGERADLIVDFAPIRGERIQLTNGAFQMMQFRVSSRALPGDGSPVF